MTRIDRLLLVVAVVLALAALSVRACPRYWHPYVPMSPRHG